ncbi:hypothetical protein N7505_007534 [Penicillium chrysogenum]|uniref:Uncharacterized protein n=1 Tax=Penicillium chrysogenum TaxID=5076 RepID=A0ABQ8WDL8_PENCH|nr:hypothetical protein N7505_007534 [Penicillium chrysogenum]
MRSHDILYRKEYEHEYLVLTAIARDNLVTPASGAGVKRLFNCARDVSNASFIRIEVRALVNRARDNQGKLTPSLNDIELISENEEDSNHAEDRSDDSENDLGDNHIVEHATPTPGKQPRRKRPYSAVKPQDDSDNNLPLPEILTEGST